MRQTLFCLFLLLPFALSAQVELIGLSDPPLKVLTTSRSYLELQDSFLYCSTSDGLYKKSLNSMSDTIWTAAGFQDMEVNDFHFIGTDTIICAVDSTEGNTLFISTDSGQSYYNSTNNFGGTGIDFSPATQITVNPHNSQHLLAKAGMCVAESRDFGQTWSRIYSDWPYFIYKSLILEVHPLDTNAYYSGGELPVFDSHTDYSLDNGQTWSTSGQMGNNAAHQLAFHPTDTNIILIGREGHIERSTDRGASWGQRYTMPNYEYVFDLEFVSDTEVYATGAINGINDSIRIYRSLDGGINWSIWRSYPLANAKGLYDFVKVGNIFYVQGHYSGVYRIDPNITPAPEAPEPQSLRIVPNPVHQILRLPDLELAKAERYRIYNGIGQEVQSGQLRTKQINCSNLTAGQHFLQVFGEDGKTLGQAAFIK